MSSSPKEPSTSLTIKVNAIRAFIAAGYTLIPLKGKIPTKKNWPTIKPGEYDERTLPQNYGVALSDTDLVVDIDPRNFADGDNPVKRLLERVGVPLDSFTVRTGGGGLHIYFRKDRDVPVVNSLKEYPGIEFKSQGRQVVGPGSVHPTTGKTYEIAHGTPQDVKDAPAALLALIQRAKPAAVVSETDAKGLSDYTDDAATQARYVSYLQEIAQPSIEGRGGDLNAFRVAAYGRDLGLPPDRTWALLLTHWNPRCQPPWEESALKAKVIHAYKYANGPLGAANPAADFKPTTEDPLAVPKAAKEDDISWVTTKQGAIVKCFQNLLTYLRLPKAGLAGAIGLNEFTNRVEFTNPAPWHRGRMPTHPVIGDNDLKLLKGHLAQKFGFEMPIQHLEEAITVAADNNRFHPVREYLQGLTWDKTLRLDFWLRDYLGVDDNDYTRACARKTLCAAVMRVMRPGCKFDHVLVLEGLQGIGKSSVCKILGGEWAADFPIDPHNKDSIQLMQGRWIIELAEMETTRRADLQTLRAFISRSTDQARLAYGRIVGEFPRQSVFIGSINPGPDGTYLQDDENRRFWPVRCSPKNGIVDFKAFKSVKNQLWAEAMAAVKKGEHLYMETSALRDQAREAVKERHADHAWAERVGAWLHELDRANPPDFLTTRDVYIDALGGIDRQFDRRSAISIAGILRDLGWDPGHKRLENRLVRGYRRREPAPRVLAPEIAYKSVLGDLI